VVPPQFAVASRQTTLSGTAKSLYLYAITGTPVAAYSHENALGAQLPKRIQSAFSIVLHRPTTLFRFQTPLLASGHSFYNIYLVIISNKNMHVKRFRQQKFAFF
jgi:hypothetical protein